ncbi:MAG: TatD family hydrolase [Spirochaetaceae bacterium]|jgi:TatD DNase family protein|nr:TatD family hydrolase [Spirochaetaceae bacterium]
MSDFGYDPDCNGLFDTHAHLSYLDGRGIDAQACVSALFESGFAGIIDIGTAADDLAERIKAFSRFDKVRFAAGVWPHKEIIGQSDGQIASLERHIDAAPLGIVVAIGECGFDRRENPDAPRSERLFLEAQLDLARWRHLPVLIHSREAAMETIDTLAAHPDVCGVIHCFSYTANEARVFLDMGYYISFAGNLTFKNAGSLREALQIVPLDRLLLETDSPYLAPAPYRGKTAHPGMVIQTYRCAADLLGMNIEDLKDTVRRNAEQLLAPVKG